MVEMTGFGMKWTTYPRSPNRADSQASQPLDQPGLSFAASGTGAVGVYRPLRGTGRCRALCCGKSSFLGCILALLPLEEAIAVSGVGRSRLYQLFDETREIKSLSLKRSGRTKERQLIYMPSVLDFLNKLAGEQARAKATT